MCLSDVIEIVLVARRRLTPSPLWIVVWMIMALKIYSHTQPTRSVLTAYVSPMSPVAYRGVRLSWPGDNGSIVCDCQVRAAVLFKTTVTQ